MTALVRPGPELSTHVRIPVTESSQIGQARCMAADFAASYPLTETEVGKAAIIATELGTNLVKHAKNGQRI